MNDRYVTLMGAEQVQSAASTMVRAADQMSRAADSIQYAFDSHQRFLEDWLVRLQDVIERKST